ncbi:MAG: diaminopimelate epimerase [Gammaproteobacteria bacterium]|nr:diaminopimelate epimerase [Gammaproteobacteria bacterium]
MSVEFTKMEGAGNDFVVIDARSAAVTVDAARCQRLADRHYGVGCDQVLVLRPDDDSDARLEIFNADGSAAQQCGNGLRCVAWFIAAEKAADEVVIRTADGLQRAAVISPGQVSVAMPVPDFEPASAGCLQPSPLVFGDRHYDFRTVSLGNPHAVIAVDSVEKAPVAELGAALQSAFNSGVNVGFAQRLDNDTLQLRVWERGAGETLACGSGACAAAVLALLDTPGQRQAAVHLPGGQLMVRWEGQGEPVILQGPATKVFEGRIDL